MYYSDYKVDKVTIDDKKYPRILTRIKNPPKKLFSRGNPKRNIFKKSIAIVGSRGMTRYGKEVIDRFVSTFVGEGITTISGFMYGVDTEVHLKTVEYGGVTVAVFGCGLNVCYPPENEKLYSKILETEGVVFSEYEPSAKPHLWKFPQRNRIVAGLSSLGVLVIEAGEKSGSLITAKLASQLGKKVFAVPGPITSAVSAGTNNLIKSGVARLVSDPADVLGIRGKRLGIREESGLEGVEKEIWKALESGELTIDEIAAAVGKQVTEVSRALSMMSLKGLVSEVQGKFYLSAKSG